MFDAWIDSRSLKEFEVDVNEKWKAVHAGVVFPDEPFYRAAEYISQFASEPIWLVQGVINWWIHPHAWVELPNGVVFDGVLQRFYDRQGYYKALGASACYKYTPQAAQLISAYLPDLDYEQSVTMGGGLPKNVVEIDERKATELLIEVLGTIPADLPSRRLDLIGRSKPPEEVMRCNMMWEFTAMPDDQAWYGRLLNDYRSYRQANPLPAGWDEDISKLEDAAAGVRCHTGVRFEKDGWCGFVEAEVSFHDHVHGFVTTWGTPGVGLLNQAYAIIKSVVAIIDPKVLHEPLPYHDFFVLNEINDGDDCDDSDDHNNEDQ